MVISLDIEDFLSNNYKEESIKEDLGKVIKLLYERYERKFNINDILSIFDFVSEKNDYPWNQYDVSLIEDKSVMCYVDSYCGAMDNPYYTNKASLKNPIDLILSIKNELEKKMAFIILVEVTIMNSSEYKKNRDKDIYQYGENNSEKCIDYLNRLQYCMYIAYQA